MTTYSEHEQRQMDIASGLEMDKRAERAKQGKPMKERIEIACLGPELYDAVVDGERIGSWSTQEKAEHAARDWAARHPLPPTFEDVARMCRLIASHIGLQAKVAELIEAERRDGKLPPEEPAKMTTAESIAIQRESEGATHVTPWGNVLYIPPFGRIQSRYWFRPDGRDGFQQHIEWRDESGAPVSAGDSGWIGRWSHLPSNAKPAVTLKSFTLKPSSS
jgi:hypothetical protein